jgi:hypothetical protein
VFGEDHVFFPIEADPWRIPDLEVEAALGEGGRELKVPVPGALTSSVVAGDGEPRVALPQLGDGDLSLKSVGFGGEELGQIVEDIELAGLAVALVGAYEVFGDAEPLIPGGRLWRRCRGARTTIRSRRPSASAIDPVVSRGLRGPARLGLWLMPCSPVGDGGAVHIDRSPQPLLG